MGDKVKITVLASGFDVTLRDSDNSVKTDRQGKEKGGIIFTSGERPSAEKALEETIKQKEVQTAIADVYGHDKTKEHFRASDELKYVVLKPSQFDDFEVISMLEKTPAFGRAPGFKDEINKIGQPERQAQRNETHENDRGAAPITF